MRDSQIAHVHAFVSDRPAAVEWLMTVWEAEPVTEDDEMSLFIFGSTQLVINDVSEDIPSTGPAFPPGLGKPLQPRLQPRR